MAAPAQTVRSTESRREPRRRHLGIMFECCSLYHRIYLNREGEAYVGRCPRCTRRARVRVGDNGVRCRFFRAV